MYVTEHCAALAPTAVSGQLDPGLKLPPPGVEKPTDPVGVVALPLSMSVTVARHVVATPTDSEDGVHVTDVLVARVNTESAAVELLGASPGLPP